MAAERHDHRLLSWVTSKQVCGGGGGGGGSRDEVEKNERKDENKIVMSHSCLDAKEKCQN